MEMHDIWKNLPFQGQVRRITPYKVAGWRIDHVLTDLAVDGKQDPKYQACIEAIKLGKNPKELQEDQPDPLLLELTKEFATKKEIDSTGIPSSSLQIGWCLLWPECPRALLLVDHTLRYQD